MSHVINLNRSIDVNCPHCRSLNEIDDIWVEMIYENTDVSENNGYSFDYGCEHCGKVFTVTPVLKIGVK